MGDYRDNMTLDEMAANDIEMAKDAVKNAKRYKFHKPQQALMFQRKCVMSTLSRLGYKFNPSAGYQGAQQVMDRAGIKVETRAKYKGAENQWRNGVYIYKSGELAAFVSEVFVKEESPIILIGDPDKYFVITNAKV